MSVDSILIIITMFGGAVGASVGLAALLIYGRRK